MMEYGIAQCVEEKLSGVHNMSMIDDIKRERFVRSKEVQKSKKKLAIKRFGTIVHFSEELLIDDEVLIKNGENNYSKIYDVEE